MDPVTIGMLVVVVAGLYFLMIRPQQKRAKQQKEHQEALKVGSRVMTVHGIFGNIVHLGEKQVVLEISPGVEMTLLKIAISNQPVQDEFEYDDESPQVLAASPSAISYDDDSPQVLAASPSAIGKVTDQDLQELLAANTTQPDAIVEENADAEAASEANDSSDSTLPDEDSSKK